MKAADLPLSATAKSVYSLTGIKRADHIFMQAPAGNAATAYFGDPDVQPMELVAGASTDAAHFPLTELYIKGSVGDYITILIW